MSVERIVPDRAGAAHSRAAELVRRGARLDRQLAAYFDEVVEVAEACREEGSKWGGPVYAPMMEAAYVVWADRGPREDRIDLDRIGPPPILKWPEE